MSTPAPKLVAIRSDADVVRVRREVREGALAIGMRLTAQTKLVTAASEIARNTLDYGGGGTMRMAIEERGARRAVRLIFQDQGPGIPDVALALTDRYTTGGGMGLGLGGAKRLCDEFAISSDPTGTRVVLACWT